MRRMQLRVWQVVLPAVILPVLAFVPTLPGNVLYAGVGHASGKSVVREGQLFSTSSYVLNDEDLYLLKQQTWHAMLLVTYVKSTTWGAPEIERLRKEHSEVDVDALWK